MNGIKYSNTVQKEFTIALNHRVMTYFKSNDINSRAGKSMLLKSLLLFGSFVGVYLLIIMGAISNLGYLFCLWALLGLGQSFIGMSIMHDAVHETYSKNKLVGFLLQIPIVSIGVEAKIWRIEHNIIHHTYPNVEGVDQDIHPRVVFRFSKHQPKKWYHSYQHLYAIFFYGLLIIEWMTIKDFIKVSKYYQEGFIKTKLEAISLTLIILFKKLFFYFIFFYLPLQFMPFNPFIIWGMFLTMLVVAGISMTIVFQLAHVVSKCEVEDRVDSLSKKNWYVHQLQTTCNFAHKNKLLTYLIGGLNYQIEHHLFPHICHTHYPAMAHIVKQTASEFGIPYHYEETFIGSVKAHFRHLREMGVK